MEENLRFQLDDRWVLLIGIPLLGIVSPLVLSGETISFYNTKLLNIVFVSFSYTCSLWLGIRHIVVFYWKKTPWEKYPFRHIIFEGLTILLYTIAVFFGIRFVEGLLFPAYVAEDVSNALFSTIFMTFFITSLHEGWFFFMQWNYTQKKADILTRENAISQYETLKSQINPHFLFNTLNTLSSLIEEDPKTAVLFVDKTADFYRQILNFREKEIIGLREELALIEDFVFLQKKRYGENLVVKVQIPETLLDSAVAPLTLQMLIENAIKHNIITSEKPLTIELFINENNYLVVRNNLQKKKQSEHSSQLGLTNISNRYEFLSPSRKVIISQQEEVFEVQVPILERE